ncbi:hypothetical protein KOW79_003028 [Hemibagrus wyckioides]|uniref:C-type lectin domain-containing protein n=1 Tax=Hemibagrus wyckioides TaxID=337641 RepID=A0A9D3P4Q8_9TELE|nr:hypothetical protein KOW79_003028 [Hemibagrus wyckioides]
MKTTESQRRSAVETDGSQTLQSKDGIHLFSLPAGDDCAVGSSYFQYSSYQGKWITYSCTTPLTFCCYQFLVLVKEKKTWEEAQEFCESHYTGLASVTSRWTLQQLILESVRTETESVWTGLRFVNGQWIWMSEEQAWSQTFFLVQSSAQSSAQSLASMPSCPALSYRCGALNTKTKTFNNQNCNEKLNFICYWT